MHATSVFTNPTVARSGPPPALLVTEGFRDEHRSDTLDPRIEYADPPVPRAHVRHLPTEMSTGGSSRQRSTFSLGI